MSLDPTMFGRMLVWQMATAHSPAEKKTVLDDYIDEIVKEAMEVAPTIPEAGANE